MTARSHAPSQSSKPHADLVIAPIGELATPRTTDIPLRGALMGAVTRIKNGAIAIAGETIIAVGTESEVRASVSITPDTQVVDARNALVTPGLIDAHTHLVFAGNRADEFFARCQGKTYEEIAEAGGGIAATVTPTRNASMQELIDLAANRLKLVLQSGTTTCEIKTGYGLDLESELKSLDAILALKEIQPVEVVPTFMAAHAIPTGSTSSAFLDEIIERMLPLVVKKMQPASNAIYIDVFCDKGYFTVDQSRRLLTEGKRLGLIPKIHSDEFVSLGATRLAVELGAATADHLLKVTPAEIDLLAKSNTVAVLLPGTSFFLNLKDHAPARRLIERGAIVCVASDFNPGSCHIYAMPFIMGLACLHLKMSPDEVLTAVTTNAAHALGLGHKLGQLRPGYQADITIYDVSSLEEIAYNIGSYLVRAVVKKGRLVFTNQNAN